MAFFQIDPHKLHFLIVPLMSHSHLIPFTDMAKLLAHRGVEVTIIMTPINAARYKSIIDNANRSNLKIQFIALRFPCREAGLPDGCENADALPSPDFIPQFYKATRMVREPLEKWLGELESQPSCMIADFCLPWTEDVALKFNIPRVVFHTTSCFTFVCSRSISSNKICDSVASDSESFLVPDIPDRVEVTKAQLPQSMNQSPCLRDLLEQLEAAERWAQGVVVNTFEELEPSYVKGFQKEVKKVWCIGPLSLSNRHKLLESENKASSIDEPQCLKWLNSKKPGSVIYVCFGTLCHLLPKQIMELGLGLEASNHSFIWVLKKGDCSAEIEKWLEDEKFEERIKGRGLIIRGWAPQVPILSNPATGGFLTHCGWNSTLEGVSAGVPMVTWPMLHEQFFNEKLILQVVKTGVRVGVEASMQCGDEENDGGVLVKREEIKRAIKMVMEGGEEGEERRKRARELGGIAKKAVEDGGSSDSNLTLLIDHVMQQVCFRGWTKKDIP